MSTRLSHPWVLPVVCVTIVTWSASVMWFRLEIPALLGEITERMAVAAGWRAIAWQWVELFRVGAGFLMGTLAASLLGFALALLVGAFLRR